LREVDIDLPLTFTELATQDDQEYTTLKFTDDDKEDPFNCSHGRKAWTTLLLCLMTLFIGLATTAYSSGIDRICEDFGASTELGQLGLFCSNMACALAPLFLAPICELVGRRIIYVGAYALFVIVFIGLALGKNIAVILVMRVFRGLFGCVGTILVGGTFTDIYRPDDRAVPMACLLLICCNFGHCRCSHLWRIHRRNYRMAVDRRYSMAYQCAITGDNYDFSSGNKRGSHAPQTC